MSVLTVTVTQLSRGSGKSRSLILFPAFYLQIPTKRSGETRIRTGDTMIFSHVRYIAGCSWGFENAHK